MSALAALIPCATLVVAILLLRTSALAAALSTTLLTLALWLSGLLGSPSFVQAERAVLDAGLLTVIVAAMIGPGILFVDATRRSGAPEALRRLVHSLRQSSAERAILVALGLGILVESLTGMGVSLLVTMPLLLALTDRRRAIALGLIGMSLMPWGALAISAQVAASLAGQSLERLTRDIFLQSAPVAAALPFLCLIAIRSLGFRDALIALAHALALVTTIGLTGAWIGIEIAGVTGGLAVVLLALLLAGRSKDEASPWTWSALLPYGVLIAAVVIQKLTTSWLAAHGTLPVLRTGRVSFAVLASPGLALLVAILIAAPRMLAPAALHSAAARAWRPITSVALLMLAARVLVEAGSVAALADVMARSGASLSIAGVALLGGLAGFLTGSGVTGNGLFMTAATSIGAAHGQPGLFAALLNGAAGHCAMASLPVGALLLAAMPGATRADERDVLLIGLALAAIHLIILTSVALFLFSFAA